MRELGNVGGSRRICRHLLEMLLLVPQLTTLRVGNLGVPPVHMTHATSVLGGNVSDRIWGHISATSVLEEYAFCRMAYAAKVSRFPATSVLEEYAFCRMANAAKVSRFPRLRGGGKRGRDEVEESGTQEEERSLLEAEEQPLWIRKIVEAREQGIAPELSEEEEEEMDSATREKYSRLAAKISKRTKGEDLSSSVGDVESIWRKGKAEARADTAARTVGEKRGAVDGLSSDSDFASDALERQSDSGGKENDEDADEKPRAVVDNAGEMTVIPGQAGKDPHFLRSIQKLMWKQGVGMKMKIPDDRGKLTNPDYDDDDYVVDERALDNLGENGIDYKELYGAKMTKEAKEAIKGDMFFDVQEDSADAMEDFGGSKKREKGEDYGKNSDFSTDAEEIAEMEEVKRKKAQKKEEKKERKKRKREEQGKRATKEADSQEEGAAASIKGPSVDEKIMAFRKENEITVTNWDGKPFISWDQAVNGLGKRLLSVCKRFPKPTAIQSECWPPLLDGRDLVGISRTGSGKTLAFVLPMIRFATTKGAIPVQGIIGAAPCALVLAPTRELAMQSHSVVVSAWNSTVERCVCVYGGTRKRQQLESLTQDVRVVVGTPGRLLDLSSDQRILLLSQVGFLVLDEADRMLDLGFEEAVKTIISQLGKKRQTVMFSATWPKDIQALAASFMQDNVLVSCGSLQVSATPQVTQVVEVIGDRERENRLRELIDEYNCAHPQGARIIVFCLYKKEAARVHKLLEAQKFNAVCIHGDMHQADRTKAMNKFRQGKVPILVATDVASRGLDIPNVDNVINFAFPLTIEDYVHRVGRTGRADKKGVAHTFFTQENKQLAGELVHVLEQSNQTVPEAMMQFNLIIKKKDHALYGSHHHDIDMTMKPTKIVFSSSDDS